MGIQRLINRYERLMKGGYDQIGLGQVVSDLRSEQTFRNRKPSSLQAGPEKPEGAISPDEVKEK